MSASRRSPAEAPPAGAPEWDFDVEALVEAMPAEPIAMSTLRAIAGRIVRRAWALDLIACADLRGRISCGPLGWEVVS